MENLQSLKSIVSHELELLEEEREGQKVIIGGIVETMRKIFTKRTGAEMAFVTIGDEKGLTIECIVFPKIYDIYKSFIMKDSLIILEGHVDTKNERPIIIAEKISTLKYSPS